MYCGQSNRLHAQRMRSQLWAGTHAISSECYRNNNCFDVTLHRFAYAITRPVRKNHFCPFTCSALSTIFDGWARARFEGSRSGDREWYC